MSPTPRRLRRRLTIVAASTAFTLALAEIGLRIGWTDASATIERGMVTDDAEVGFRLVPNWTGQQVGTDAPVAVVTNARGYRNGPIATKRPGQRRIVVLGDSFAFGHCVAAEVAFPAVIEQGLRAAGNDVEVINTGVPGYTTHHEFHLLATDGPALQPDDVVLAFYVGNDFRGNHVERFGRLVVENGQLTTRMADASFADRAATFLVAHSRLALLVARAMQPKAKVVDSGVRVECAGADWDVGFGMAMARRTWDADAEAAWQESLLWITAVRDLCQQLGARFHLVLLPAPHQYSALIWKLAKDYCHFDDREFVRSKPNDRLVEWARDNGIAVLDLLPEFVAQNDDVANRLYIDCHFSALGHTLAAETMIQGLGLAGR